MLEPVEQSGQASEPRSAFASALARNRSEPSLLGFPEQIGVPGACELLLDRIVHLRSLRVG
jgi:hypothetical protein